jgi:hypothetical protein
MSDMSNSAIRPLEPSILYCQCMDGPYEGYVERVGVRAKCIQVRPLHDAGIGIRLPAELYTVIELPDGVKELVWSPRGYFGPEMV